MINDFREKSETIINEYQYEGEPKSSVRITFCDHKLSRVEGTVGGRDLPVSLHSKDFWKHFDAEVKHVLQSLDFLSNLRRTVIDLEAIHDDELKGGHHNG